MAIGKLAQVVFKNADDLTTLVKKVPTFKAAMDADAAKGLMKTLGGNTDVVDLATKLAGKDAIFNVAVRNAGCHKGSKIMGLAVQNPQGETFFRAAALVNPNARTKLHPINLKARMGKQNLDRLDLVFDPTKIKVSDLDNYALNISKKGDIENLQVYFGDTLKVKAQGSEQSTIDIIATFLGEKRSEVAKLNSSMKKDVIAKLKKLVANKPNLHFEPVVEKIMNPQAINNPKILENIKFAKSWENIIKNNPEILENIKIPKSLKNIIKNN